MEAVVGAVFIQISHSYSTDSFSSGTVVQHSNGVVTDSCYRSCSVHTKWNLDFGVFYFICQRGLSST